MSEVKNSLAIFLGAMLGGLLRYQCSSFFTFTGHFPLATLLVNYLGTFLLVYLVKGYLRRKQVSKRLLLALSTGFCGGLTTFSTLNDELQKLLSDKKAFYSYLLLTYLLGFLAIFLGILL